MAPVVVREDDLKLLGQRFGAFCSRFDLSMRDVEKLCGGPSVLSKSTIHRVIKADAQRERVLAVVRVLDQPLRAFLKTKNLSQPQIDAEMKALFPPSLTTLYCDPSVSYEGLPTWRERLDAFRRRRGLPYHRLWLACGGDAICSHKVMKQVCTGEYIRDEKKFKPEFRTNLLNFLMAAGIGAEAAAAEIAQIFDEEGDTMIAPRTTLPLEAQEYFRLRRDPFTGDPRSKAEVFTTPQLDRLAERVLDAINYQGFVVVTGDIGSGKSLLKRRTVDVVENSGGRIRLFFPEFMNMDRVHSGSIVTYLLRKLDQPVPSDLVMRADKLKQVLGSLNEDGVRVAIAFDECHRLHDQLLTALKNFWELGSGGYDRFLGVVLFGQLQFEGRLRDHRFREICERIEVARMPPLDKAAWDYVCHRVKLAGGDAERLFEREAIKLLSKQASTPLALGNLANAALLKAHTLGERKVLADFIGTDDHEPRVRAVRRAS